MWQNQYENIQRRELAALAGTAIVNISRPPRYYISRLYIRYHYIYIYHIYIYTEKRRVGRFATLCTAAPILPHPSGARLHHTQSTVPNFINTFKNSSLVKKGDVVGVRLVLVFILFFFLAI